MKKVIYKYRVKKEDSQIIKMVKGAEIKSCQIQYDDICLWVEVDPNETETESRQIILLGTGYEYEFSGHMVFLGTIQFMNGSVVNHVFELVP